MDAIIHLLKYVKFTCRQSILLQGSSTITLQAYSGTNWTSFPVTRRSITLYIVTWYIVLLSGSPSSWKSKKQPTIATSSSEACRAMAQAAVKVTRLV